MLQSTNNRYTILTSVYIAQYYFTRMSSSSLVMENYLVYTYIASCFKDLTTNINLFYIKFWSGPRFGRFCLVGREVASTTVRVSPATLASWPSPLPCAVHSSLFHPADPLLDIANERPGASTSLHPLYNVMGSFLTDVTIVRASNVIIPAYSLF